MNILIVTQYFWPENFRINDIALGLKEKGHNITVLTGIPNYPNGHFFEGYGIFGKMLEDYHGVKVVRVPLAPRGKGGGVRLALNYLSFALFASVLGPIRRLGACDLIFVYEPSPITVGLPALILKKIKSSPIMFWVQDLWPESLSATGAVSSQILLKMVNRLVLLIYRSCDRILVQSRAFIRPIEALGIKPSRIVYFPNSAEQLYSPTSVEPDASERILMPKGFCVLFAGNIGAAQDFPTIVNAAAKLKDYKDIHWVIIGDGRMRTWVEEQVRVRGLTNSVHLLGSYPAETMPRFFSIADALLVTLKKEPIFAFTVPSKIQSYLACAKPIIAALEGEGARIIEEAGAGIVCSSEDPSSLAQAVLSLYRKSQDERRSMGESGRQYFEKNFERSMLLSGLENWMTELVISNDADLYDRVVN